MAKKGGAEPTTLSPEEAFAVLGNEVRMEILKALWDASEPLTFSALRERVGMPDSGQFNYHLGKLEGHFVRRGEETYELAGAGETVMRAVFAGAITENPTFGPTELETRCPYCGASAEAWYDDEVFTARCTRCAGVTEDEDYPVGTFMQYQIPPAGVLGRSPDEVLSAAHVLYDSKLTAMFEGICPECAATVEFTFHICQEHAPAEDGLCPACQTRRRVWIEPVCGNCQYRRMFPAWFVAMTSPDVIAFFVEKGAPWDRVPFPKLTWENAQYVGDISEEVRSEDPVEILVRIPVDDDELQATIDEQLNVVTTTA